MKQRFLLLIIVYFAFTVIGGFAAVYTWNRPHYIKTYIPPKHKYTKLMKEAFSRWTNSSDAKGSIYAPIVLGTSEQISLRKLKEAQNYIKNASDLAGGYMDLGIAYSELNKKKEGIKAIEKAFNLSKTESEKYLASYNLALVHLQNKDYQKAETFATIAGEISNSEEVKDLLMKINHEKISSKKIFYVF